MSEIKTVEEIRPGMMCSMGEGVSAKVIEITLTQVDRQPQKRMMVLEVPVSTGDKPLQYVLSPIEWLPVDDDRILSRLSHATPPAIEETEPVAEVVPPTDFKKPGKATKPTPYSKENN